MQVYEGSENFIFISYAHKDSEVVLPILERMQKEGFRIWFDSGVEAGTEWPEYIAEHLESAAVVLVLMSNAATASRNCRDEINFALDMGKDMLVVHLEEAKLTAGMRLRLSAIQAMFRYRAKTQEIFLTELCKTKILQNCRVQVKVTPAPVETEEEVVARAPVAEVTEAVPVKEETPDELCARGDRLYREGNYAEAAKCYRKAAGEGHSGALAGLARCYFNGNGVAQDHDEAFDLYAEAAEKGSPRGMCGLGNCYYDGLGARKDYTRAFNYYLAAAERGDSMAMNNLALCYLRGHGVKENLEEGIRYLRMAAENGDAFGQYNLGIRHISGEGVPRDRNEAFRWLTLAAENGHAKAREKLANLDQEFAAVPAAEALPVVTGNDAQGLFEQGRQAYKRKDYALAVECYQKSMDLGNQDAAAGLGICYYYGRGVEEDKDRALELFIASAQSGSAVGQNSLGFCYYDGKIVQKSPARAATWYRKAADQGHAQATFNLGLLYYKGDGVPQDYAIAVELLRKAADQGYESAIYQLGICYERGHGVIQNNAEAQALFRKAADMGHEKARNKLGGGSVAPGAPVGETAQQLLEKGDRLYGEKKYFDALQAYQSAANMGLAEGKAGMARCYYTGNGVARDSKRAFELFSEAARGGSGRGYTGLGNCFYDGAGVTRDYAKAAEHYRKAVELGEPSAMTNLGYCYSHGHGVKEDHAQAVHYYRMGARKGNAQSMFNLGLAYLEGRGITKDDPLAELWIRKAADEGHEKAKKKLAELEEAKKKKAAASVPDDFVILDQSGNSVDIMEYMMALSQEAKKRRYVCQKCKTGFMSADRENPEPCPNCGAMVEKK